MGVMEKLIRHFNSEDVVKFSDKNVYSKSDFWLPTGSPEMEYNLEILGYPVGLVELSGESKSGKTTLALTGMRNFQRKYPDGVSIILSSELRDNKILAENIGVNTSKVIIVKSKILEYLFYRLQTIIKETHKIWKEEKLKGNPKFYIMWDSLGGTMALAEAKTFEKNVLTAEKNEDREEGEKEEKLKNAQMMAFAKNAKMAAKSMLAQIYCNDICFVILNHRYDKVGFNQHGTKSGGGRWVELFCTLRLELIRTDWVKLDNEEVAQITKVKVEKNDFGRRRPTDIEILLGYGIVLSASDIQYAVKKKLLKVVGKKSYSFMNGKLKWNSNRTLYQNYKDKNKFIPILESLILKSRHQDTLKEKGLE